MSTKTYSTGTTLVVGFRVVNCFRCGVLFGITANFEARRRDDKASFYCPNGHGQAYKESEADRLRKEVARVKASRDLAWQEEQRRTKQLEAVAGSLRATKGHVTRLRKHVDAGLCPYGCKRHFSDLQLHIASKHKGEALAAEMVPETERAGGGRSGS